MTRPLRAALGIPVLLAISVALAASGDRIEGVASIVDGDTLEIHGQRIRLRGVDAPESSQICHRDGHPWRCGQAAALALSTLVGRQTVTCDVHGRDRYKRAVATCTVGGEDMNQWLVESGWALDWPRYSKGAYAEAEQAAKAAMTGVWASEFQPPWEWRRSKRSNK
jgi:endonuclease YncB( thermonuclease family)